MTKDEAIKEIAVVLGGLQVPVSMGVPLGAAKGAWSHLADELVGFGWHGAEDYEAGLRRVLGAALGGEDG